MPLLISVEIPKSTSRNVPSGAWRTLGGRISPWQIPAFSNACLIRLYEHVKF